jgi:type VI secretion system protein VasG
VERFKNGNTRTPVFSARLPKLFEQAWLIASLDLQDDTQAQIRSGHLLLALLTDTELAQLAARSSKLFARFDLDRSSTIWTRSPPVRRKPVRSPLAAGEGGDPVGELQRAPPARRRRWTSSPPT